MVTKIEIVEVSRIPGRQDVMAIVDFVEGDFVTGCDDYVHTATGGVWRITSIGSHQPNLENEKSVKRLPLGLKPHGKDDLKAGDLLECSNCDSTSQNSETTTTTP